MNNKEILKKLKEIQTKLESGLGAEFEDQQQTNPEFQFDARIIESRIELEELIDNLSDEINDTPSKTVDINIGDCDMNYESGKLTIPKSEEIDKIDKAHQEWFGKREIGYTPEKIKINEESFNQIVEEMKKKL